MPPEYIIYVVRYGLRAMPAFAASFIDDQAPQEVASYVSKSAVEHK
ncbi:MAG: c-type cytochrome [Candidatus Nitrosoglobus sp.]